MHLPHRRTSRTSPPARSTLVALSALLLLLAACAPGGGGNGDATPTDDDGTTAAEESGDPVELRMTIWSGNEDHLALFDSIAEAYLADHPEVASIDFEVLPFEDYADAVTVQLAGGNPPDLGWILERNAPELIDAGVLADIQPALEETEGYGFDDLSAGAMELWQADGATYAYPFSTSPFSIFYNADMIAAAGAPDPQQLVDDGEWTWDAVAGISDAVTTSGSGEYGLIVRDFDYEVWPNLASVWRGWGADPWSEDGTTCTFDSAEMVDAMTWFTDLIAAGGTPGPGQSGDFFAGESAMTITQISRAGLLEDAGFEWGLVPLPSGPGGAQPVIGQAGIGAFAAGGNVAAATEFLAWFTNEENSRSLARFFPPPRESLLNAEVLGETNPLLSEEQLEQVVVTGIAQGATLPSHPRFAELLDTVRAELDGLWEPGADVPTALAEVCQAVDPVLAG